MLKQTELLNLLNKLITSHEFRLEDNKIYGRNLIRGGKNFRSFNITYLKSVKDTVSLNAGGQAIRYINTIDLIIALGAMAYYDSDSKIYKSIA